MVFSTLGEDLLPEPRREIKSILKEKSISNDRMIPICELA